MEEEIYTWRSNSSYKYNLYLLIWTLPWTSFFYFLLINRPPCLPATLLPYHHHQSSLTNISSFFNFSISYHHQDYFTNDALLNIQQEINVTPAEYLFFLILCCSYRTFIMMKKKMYEEKFSTLHNFYSHRK
jgi:hypothetical protein